MAVFAYERALPAITLANRALHVRWNVPRIRALARLRKTLSAEEGELILKNLAGRAAGI